jgi:hypothetical protein
MWSGWGRPCLLHDYGGQVNGTRGPLGSNVGSNALQSNMGSANYNALELSARHTSGRLEFSAAYTYSKSLDQSSNIGEEVNPFNPALSYALSSFSAKHNFVVSYEYQLPFDRFFPSEPVKQRLVVLWHYPFRKRLPHHDGQQWGQLADWNEPNGMNNSSIDEPDYTGGPLHLNHNPHTKGNSYFDTSVFPINQVGEPGTSKRRFFYGPGSANYDMAVAKNLPITESKSLLLRVGAFNVFNHTQFNGPSSVDGNIGSSPLATPSALRLHALCREP